MAHFVKAFPTLFKPIETPQNPVDGESQGVLDCVQEFLQDNEQGWNNAFPASELSANALLRSRIDKMRTLASSFCDLHSNASLSAKQIHRSIGKLDIGAYWGMRLVGQNAVLLLFRRDAKNVDVSVWECQQVKGTIMGRDEAVRQVCPRAATRVPWARISTLATSEYLHELYASTPERAFPKSRKAGEQVKETRDVANPMYATEMLVDALGGERIDLSDIVGVHKKACDDVVYANGALPWRRVPDWMALKSLLHVVCVRDAGVASEAAEIPYKIFVQNFLAFCMQGAVRAVESGEVVRGVVTDSAIVEGRNKLVRRLVKICGRMPELRENAAAGNHTGGLLSSVFGTSGSTCLHKNLFRKSKRFCSDVVGRCVEMQPGAHWKELNRSAKSCDISPDKLRPSEDIKHKLETSGNILAELWEKKEQYFLKQGVVDVDEPDASHRSKKGSLVSFQSSRKREDDPAKAIDEHRRCLEQSFAKDWKTTPQEVIGHLHDIREHAISDFARLSSDDSFRRRIVAKAGSCAPQLLDLLRKYVRVGLEVFKNDPLGCGGVILTAMTIVLICDLLACEEHPLLREHVLGIESVFLRKIFVSTAALKKHLHAVENYIEQRNDRGRYDSTIRCWQSSSSFGVRFAEQCADMKTALEEIQETCNRNQNAKRDERQRLKNQYEELMEYARCHGCSCGYVGCWPNERFSQCTRCSKKDQAATIKMSYYEKLLPPSFDAQRAVVFELRQPTSLVIQRESIFVFLALVCEEKWSEPAEGRYLWSGENRLNPWRTVSPGTLCEAELGSTRKKWSCSHYGKQDHVTSHADFIVNHDFRTELMGSLGTVKQKFEWNVDRLCSVKVPKRSRYEPLEKWFNGYDHTENDVIAKKSEASEELSLTEFEKAGTLRAGVRLQLVRLVSSLHQKDLALEREEIVSLISAALWQAGPPGEVKKERDDCSGKPHLVLHPDDVRLGGEDDWFRQNAECLRMAEFINDICEKLVDVLDGCSRNWSCQNVLLNVIHIARFLLEHAKEGGGSSVVIKVLRRCRKIAQAWLSQLVQLSNDCGDDAEMQKLRARIVDVAVMGSLTFADIEGLLAGAEDAAMWIFFRATFNDNVSPAEILEDSWRRQHLLHAYVVAEDVASRVASILEKDTSRFQSLLFQGVGGLSRFLQLYWSAAEQGRISGRWKQYECASHWYHVQFEGSGSKCTIQVNVVAGVFLVDGTPCKSLPREITSHDVYRRLFGTSVFAVQPSGTGGYRTSMPIVGFVYEFHSCPDKNFGDGAPIIIKEHSSGECCTRALLLPDSIFSEDLPQLLVDEFSHWYALSVPANSSAHKNHVFFRPVRYCDERFTTPDASIMGADFLDKYVRSSRYKLDCTSRVLQDTMNGHSLIDVRSATMTEMFDKVFQRLAPRLYVHAFLPPETASGRSIHVQLPKLQNLKFNVSLRDGGVTSSDFKGFSVAVDQNSGTFLGLRHGLLLEGRSAAYNRMFLCPHGEVVRQTKAGAVHINVAELREPAFFKYEFRPELQDVRASSSDRMASLYLAHLHQCTSGLLPDPFTGTTGTSRAFEILRSARCCGNLINSIEEERLEAPLSREGLMMYEIARVSPIRTDYHDMEMSDIPRSKHHALCAHVGFAYLVDIRVAEIKQALRIIGKGSLKILNSDQEKDLGVRRTGYSKRAYFQHQERHTKDVGLTTEEEARCFGSNRTMNSSTKKLEFKFTAERTSMREIGYAAQNAEEKVNQKASISDLLCGNGNDNLVGVDSASRIALSGTAASIFEGLQVAAIANNKRPFHDIWLNLYKFARHEVNDADKRTAFGFLLTWVASEYPIEIKHLQQLAIVAENQADFPSAKSLHASYEKPYEQKFIPQYVEELLEKHLTKFTLSAPVRFGSNYEDRLDRWRERKREHATQRQNAKDALLRDIRSRWDRGARASFSVGNSLLTSSSSFSSDVEELFKRWQRAIDLQRFIDEVTSELKRIQRPLRTVFDIEDYNSVSACDCKGDERRFHTVPTSIEKLAPIAPTRMQDPSVVADRVTALVKRNAITTTSTARPLNLRESFLQNVPPEYNEISKDMLRRLERSWELAQLRGKPEFRVLKDAGLLREELKRYEREAESVMLSLWKSIEERLRETAEPGRDRLETGFWDSITPMIVLRQFVADPVRNAEIDSIHPLVLKYMVALKHVQRARRCQRLLDHESTMRTHLMHELSNPGCEGWTPEAYPEWLLLEVDNDVGIRKIQAEVALEILDDSKPNSDANRLMQMNMGEGKTDVIMPLVLSVAPRCQKLVRATVLSSLYATNAATWQHKLGGVLGRRVYPMLCRRDLKIGTAEAELMVDLCEYIRREKHVVVTVPEHRLSLENKALELASEESLHQDEKASRALHRVLDLFNTHGRDFLDESDEILSPKYQLIYTLGAQQDFDGGRLRWAVHGAIFEALAHTADALQGEFSSDTIELLFRERRCTEYPGLRLLEAGDLANAYAKITKLVLDFILSGETDVKVTLKADEMRVFKRCVAGLGTGADVENLPPNEKLLALTLRGVLDHGVLQLVLQKRWRVHYGAHPTSQSYLMAVPFRAKDVAADRTEFGHPDMMLMLTYAHYYQEGLSEAQLREVFVCLKRMSESEAKSKYRSWVEGLAPEEVEGIASYEGVNLEDGTMFRERLLPVFRRHMKVVRFWLTMKVFPVQAKQFPKKLLATAPDLCRSEQLGPAYRAVTTGFSGTDDLSVLLPPTIQQRNMESLELTNGQQLLAFLREENNDYESLCGGNSADEILDLLTRPRSNGDKLNVVLDPGGLVLELANRPFVEAWLKLRPDMEAGAYFEGDAIKVVTRDGAVLPFHVSPYADDMSRCLLYLDDIHTRGSDFRLPLDTRALLTLGKGMPKDKFLQACMRMRQLGVGQSLTFVASHEVDLLLRSDFNIVKEKRQHLGVVRVVLQWTLRNTVQRICDLIPYFVGQVRACMHKAHAYNVLYHGKRDSERNFEELAYACLEKEVMRVTALYGHERGKDLVSNIVARQLTDKQAFGDCLVLHNSGNTRSRSYESAVSYKSDSDGDNDAEMLDASSSEPMALMHDMQTTIKNRFKMLAPRVERHCSMFDEEQERELEQELEEETQTERPAAAVPMKAEISQGLRDAVIHPISLKSRLNPNHMFMEIEETCVRKTVREHFQPLSEMFEGTDHAALMREQLADCGVFVTTDFVQTVKGRAAKDAYVKNIRWLLRFGGEGGPLVIVSNLEAEALAQLLLVGGVPLPKNNDIRFSLDSLTSYELFPFAGMTRLQQPRQFLKSAAFDPPAMVHVFGGSVHADDNLLADMRGFLGLCPRPARNAEAWDALLTCGAIERDGFVPQDKRPTVRNMLGDTGIAPAPCPSGSFSKSPVRCLLSFFSNVRHLGNELAVSSVGRLLGASDIQGEDDIDDAMEVEDL